MLRPAYLEAHGPAPVHCAVDHMVLVEQQRTQRRAMYDEEKEGELAATQEAARREDYRKQVIAEAKKRLLDEHAARLQEYMPRL